MRLRAIVAFTSAALAVAAACSTFEEAPIETAPDAGTEAGSDSPNQTDGTSTADGGSDAWVPCSTRGSTAAHFCDDFDRQGAIDFDWALTRDGDGSAAFYEGGTSLPNAFRSSVPASTKPPGRAQMIHKTAPPASMYRLEFDVRVDAIPHTGTTGYSHLAVVEFDDAPCSTGGNSQRSLELSLYAFDMGVKIYEKGMKECPGGDAAIQGSEDAFAITPAQLVDGQFRHVTITLENKPCPGTQSKMSLYATLGALTTKCRGFDIDMFATSKKVWTYLGAYIGATGYQDTAYVYDNVTIDLQ